MKKKFMILVLLSLPLFSHAQFGNILKKVQNKAAEIVERKAEIATESVLNGGTDKKESQADAGAGTTTDVKPSAAADPLVAYSRFDFVPGEKIIYADDFAQDAVGEFPLQWTTKGKGEVMTLQGQPGKWLRGYKNSLLTSVNKNELGDNYTVEFDLIYFLGAKAAVYVMPDLLVRLLNNYTVDYKNRSGNVSEREGEQSFQFQIHPKDDASLAWVENYGTSAHYQSDKVEVSQFSKLYNQPVHYAIQVQKNRLRVWLNEKKVVDLPQAINMEKQPARIALGLGSTSFNDDEVGFYVSNIRMAKGEPDTRHELLETGSFSTTGILFDVNSDHIKPQSFGLLNELSKLLAGNPSLKIRISGHTSSDGSAAANLELSNKRAQAVKEYFGKAGIDTSRMETAGLGDTKPVASNGSQKGRAQNRRVEFTML